ncbi:MULTISPECIES: GSCFA domain-containing protein [unclassified Beijerinckia]|uniref:GSCFA domain-containing protein n=1 Tax=unclassified Beijerinckia TaxID=2638183 RepID=UPI000896D10F|nr:MULTISPECIES: GSCFA domain-containing protein [unclassified Beijerinckia]MDH7793963.1 hypothetical protein [Beijerinckia sp. GAS462]SEB50380.1 GSCFA family protein [Beijerinckia sp. 28-YEA-48]
MARGPYNNLPSHQFWRSAVASMPSFAIDPIVSVPFTIAPSDKVASAGSCFAQRVARQLQSSGYHYYVPEDTPPGLNSQEAFDRNYRVFSCRYGNIYTTAQLRQTFDRAFGRLKPDIEVWTRPDGRFVDPYRPLVEPDGFATAEALHASREEHLRLVREMFENLDVFVLTLGLTEHFRSKSDKVVLPVAPGVSGGTWDPDIYEYHNARVSEIVADLLAFIDNLRSVNPKSRIIISVSPVSMLATYEPRHVVVSNSYTKSALRVAADEVCNARPNVAYFPSYDIVLTPFNAGRIYTDDQRELTELGVDLAMKTFFDHFTEGGNQATHSYEDVRFDAAAEAASAARIVCDEVAIES